jgi:hypothetical protein
MPPNQWLGLAGGKRHHMETIHHTWNDSLWSEFSGREQANRLHIKNFICF